MEAISMLNLIKNKVLDAEHYEILKHAYELQEENIKQLKTSNETIKENNKLLQEKVVQIENENEEFSHTLDELRKKLSQFNGEQINLGLSEVAKAVLSVFLRLDKIELWKETDIIPALGFSQIQIESAIDELLDKNFLIPSLAGSGVDRNLNPMRKKGYALTTIGKSYLVQNSI